MGIASIVPRTIYRADPGEKHYEQTSGIAEDKPGAKSWNAKIPAPRKQNTNGSAIWNETRRSCVGVKRKEANIVASKTADPSTTMLIAGPGCLKTVQTCVTKIPGSEESGQTDQT
jgi:hypothetical protein